MKPRFLVMSILVLFAACAADNGDGGGDGADACETLAGTWEIAGTCGPDVCTITQSGCAITQVSCTSGARSTSGDIDGDDYRYTGTSGGGVAATCSGTASGNSLAGSCTTPAGTCSVTGTRR